MRFFLNRGSGVSARLRATADHGDEACSVTPEDELRASFPLVTRLVYDLAELSISADVLASI